MKKRVLLASVLIVTALALLVLACQPTRALPEYASQTGEPCATCHISPSGGGLRTPRGLAWVSQGRPGAVPALTDALALLGVKLTSNQADFVAVPGSVPTPQPPQSMPVQSEPVRAWLRTYEGN
jgi:hypothetical protein